MRLKANSFLGRLALALSARVAPRPFVPVKGDAVERWLEHWEERFREIGPEPDIAFHAVRAMREDYRSRALEGLPL